MNCECNCQPCVASDYYISHIVVRFLINMKQLLILLNKKNEANTICNDKESKFLTHEKICTTHLNILFEYSVT